MLGCFGLHVGGLDWTKINPDIFGSMIQAVAADVSAFASGDPQQDDLTMVIVKRSGAPARAS